MCCFASVISGEAGSQLRDLCLSRCLKALQHAGLLFPFIQIQMWSVWANLKVHVPNAPSWDWLMRSSRSCRRENSPRFSGVILVDVGVMASAHDRAVLRAIFNPSTPFGDNSDLNQTETLDDDGECALHVSTRHVKAFYVYHFTPYWNYFYISISRAKKITWHFNPAWFVCDTSEFSLPPHLSVEFECLSPCLSPLTRQWLWHGVAEASESAGVAGRLCSRGWGFARCTSIVQPGYWDPASASLGL